MRKLGVSKTKLMNHLRATGLINRCFTNRHGYWQIPYSVAERISSPQALSLQVKQERSRGVNSRESLNGHEKTKERGLSFQARQPTFIPDYAQIGKALRQAGVTMTDLIKYIEQQMEVIHEQSLYNSTKRDEAQSNGSANSDISNSSEK